MKSEFSQDRVIRIKTNNFARWTLILFGLAFVFLSGIPLSTGVSEIRSAISSSDWIETSCIIEQSGVQSHPSKDKKSTTYSVLIRYAYEWKGTKYIGNQYNFSSGSSSDYDSKVQVTEQYHAGSKSLCHVNPQAPEQAVLSKSVDRGSWIITAMGVLFCLIGFGSIIGGLSFKNKYLNLSKPRVPTSLRVAEKPLHELLFILPLAGIGGLFAITLFIHLVQHYREYERPYLIIVPIFILIGSAMVVYAAWLLKKSFGPKPTLIMPSVIYLGETVSLTWKLEGDLSRVNGLGISLQCMRRHRIHRRGRAITAESFTKGVNIIWERDSSVASSGQLTFTVPCEGPPTGKKYLDIFWRMTLMIFGPGKSPQTWTFDVVVVEAENPATISTDGSR
jgi:hypothetical protein